MRRADRLFQLLTLLRNRRMAVTAGQLAERLEVSQRTVYRDIQSLLISGVPIEGEAGVGYRLNRHFDLPPLMFDTSEIEALLLGARMVQAWSDKQLATAASGAMQKILAVMPEHLRHSDDEETIIAFDSHFSKEVKAYSAEIRAAIKARNILAIEYQRADGEYSSRRIQPLGLVYWGRVWTLVAWCELRQNYREFRLDRIRAFQVTANTFATMPEKNLKHYIRITSKAYESSDYQYCSPQTPL